MRVYEGLVFSNFAKTAEKPREELDLSGVTYAPGYITIANVSKRAHTDPEYVISNEAFAHAYHERKDVLLPVFPNQPKIENFLFYDVGSD